MTTDGKQNRFGRFIMDEEQAERIAAGDMSAVWAFIENNRMYLTRWARKFLRVRLYFLPKGYYEEDDLLNQIYVDLPFYDLSGEKGLGISVFRSFMSIDCGGIRFRKKRQRHTDSLDAPLSVAARSGDKEDGGTLQDLLPNREPTPEEAFIRRETDEALIPRAVCALSDALSDGGTMTEKMKSELADLLEYVFVGYTFEQLLAKSNARHA